MGKVLGDLIPSLGGDPEAAVLVRNGDRRLGWGSGLSVLGTF